MAVKIVTNDWIIFFNEVGFDRYRGMLDQRAAADRLLGYGLELIIVTLAEKGCVVYSKDETILLRIKETGLFYKEQTCFMPTFPL